MIDVPPGLETWFASHFETSLGSPLLAMAVVSMRDELVAEVWRHVGSGFLVQLPADHAAWTSEQRSWLATEFEPTPSPEPADALDMLQQLARSLVDDAVLTVFNVSTHDPAGVRYDFGDDVYSLRAHRFDLALERTAATAGFAIVDVDRSVAEYGGARAVEAPATYTEEASEVIAEDALVAITELGVAALSLDAEIMRLQVPAYDRRTATARVDSWHVAPGTAVERGSPLFDLTFDNLVHRLDYSAQETNRSMAVTVLAADAGRVTTVGVAPGTAVEVGQTIAAVVKVDSVESPSIEQLEEGVPPFRIGIRVK